MTSINLGQSGTNAGKSKNRGAKQLGTVSLVSSIAFGLLAFGVSPAAAAEPPVPLDTASQYSVLAGSTVTNTGPSILNQNLGLHPGSSVTGFPPGLVNGTVNVANGPALQAKTDLTNAYNDAAGRSITATTGEDLTGTTLTGGVYKSWSGTTSLTGELTLDGQNDPNSVFIFQTDSTLITGAASKITLINNAQACNVYWQVGSSATLGSGSSFVGTIMALTSITAETSATIEGRTLARNGAVTLDNNVFTTPGCDMTVPAPVVVPAPVTPSPVVTPTPSTTPSAPATTPTTPTPSTPVDSPSASTPVTTPSSPTVNTPNGSSTTDVPNDSSTTDTPADSTTGLDTPANPEPELAATGLSASTQFALGTSILLLMTGLALYFSGRFLRTGKH